MKKLIPTLFLTAAFTSTAFANIGSSASGPLVECELNKGTSVMTAVACENAKLNQNATDKHYANDDPSERIGGSTDTHISFKWKDPSEKSGGGYAWVDPSEKTGGGYTWEDPSEKTGGGFA